MSFHESKGLKAHFTVIRYILRRTAQTVSRTVIYVGLLGDSDGNEYRDMSSPNLCRKAQFVHFHSTFRRMAIKSRAMKRNQVRGS